MSYLLEEKETNMFWIAILLLILDVEGDQDGLGCADHGNNLESRDSCLSQPSTDVCSGEVQLQNVLEAGLEEKCKEEEKVEENSGCLFLLETSTRDVLTAREACALESAARNSGLKYKSSR